LLAGTVVSGLRVLWVALRQRRLDPFALFLLALFGAGLALSFATGDARFILAKDAAGSCTAGLVFLGSCIIKRPIAYYAAQRFARSAGSAQHEEFQATAQSDMMRARWYRVSLVWGIALLLDVSLRVAAIHLLPIRLAANSSLTLRVRQVVILPVGAVWRSAYELYAHSAVARSAGLPADLVVRALAAGEPSALTLRSLRFC
jgi:hypothetical protein